MANARNRPNIVFILADDMGYGDFSRFNGGLSQTPTLDALMDESVCLTQHYSGSPVCNPSRAALLTGRYPHRTGSIDTLEWHGLERLALREITLADMLQRAGYRTGLVGKWHLGSYDRRYHPCRRGFDEAVCFRGGMHDYWLWRIDEGEDKVRRGDGRYLTDVWTEEAVGFLDRHAGGDKPFFLHVTYNAPHTPLQCPPEEVAPFAETGKFTSAVSFIYGMIKRMDAGIARILEAIDRSGARDNTIVLFCSDNGPQFGGLGDGCLNRFNCQFHGAKGSTYEGGVRVPLLIRWPDGLVGGRNFDPMVHMTDWLPTLLDAVGIEPPNDRVIDGVSVLPVLRGEPGKVQTTRCWQWNRYEPVLECNAAIRDGDWKLVRPHMPEAMRVFDGHLLAVSMYEPEHFIEGGLCPEHPPRTLGDAPPLELYNIADDPRELNDLAAQEADRVHRLNNDLENWFAEVEAERMSIDDER